MKNNKRNIIGRCLVIHEDEDDCGKGQSVKTIQLQDNYWWKKRLCRNWDL